MKFRWEISKLKVQSKSFLGKNLVLVAICIKNPQDPEREG